jgi:hypothetical protein
MKYLKFDFAVHKETIAQLNSKIRDHNSKAVRAGLLWVLAQVLIAAFLFYTWDANTAGTIWAVVIVTSFIVVGIYLRDLQWKSLRCGYMIAEVEYTLSNIDQVEKKLQNLLTGFDNGTTVDVHPGMLVEFVKIGEAFYLLGIEVFSDPQSLICELYQVEGRSELVLHDLSDDSWIIFFPA